MSEDTQGQQGGHGLRHVSPLRYPGGKTALADFLARTIESNDLSGCSYFEPFAGGAGAALRLLLRGVVSEVYLNDLDPRIFSFWKAVLDESDRFAETILHVPVNLKEWRRQSAICRRADVARRFELGFATFYMNRCNRSGIITGAAPIGGYAQDGDWKMDARFYRERLAERIGVLASKRDQIHVTGRDAKEFLVESLPGGGDQEPIFVYLDPPYYSKGSRLYMNSYEDDDHKTLAEYMETKNSLKWIASYDDTEFIRGLYSSCSISDNVLQYSLQRKRQVRELLIAPSHVRLPEATAPRDDAAAPV